MSHTSYQAHGASQQPSRHHAASRCCHLKFCAFLPRVRDTYKGNNVALRSHPGIVGSPACSQPGSCAAAAVHPTAGASLDIGAQYGTGRESRVPSEDQPLGLRGRDHSHVYSPVSKGAIRLASTTAILVTTQSSGGNDSSHNKESCCNSSVRTYSGEVSSHDTPCTRPGAGPERLETPSRSSSNCSGNSEWVRSNSNSGCGGGGGDGGGGHSADCKEAASGSVAARAAAASPSSLVEDTTADNWRTRLRRPGSVVALGKFDALHRGHRALATAAAALASEIALGDLPADDPISTAAATPEPDTSSSASSPVPPPASRPPARSSPSTSHDSTAVQSGDAAASARGEVVLLSFSGMAAVLGWPNRLPLTAPQERGRVLASWAGSCSPTHHSGLAGIYGCAPVVLTGRTSTGAFTSAASAPGSTPATASASCSPANAAASPRAAAAAAAPSGPRLRTMPFSLIRGMSPEQFVALLAEDLGAAGVVAGRNYRFGYKAAGDADTLVRLGRKYGLRVAIVDLVQLPDTYRPAVRPGQQSDCCCDATGSSIVENSSSRSTSAGGNPVCDLDLDRSISVTCMHGSGGNLVANGGVSVRTGASYNSEGICVGPSYSRATVQPPQPPTFNGGASTDLDAELEGGNTAAAGPSSGGDGGTRVSSSRIRTLLENGQVENVERLLGRKYRLVCDLAAAETTTTDGSRQEVSSGGFGRNGTAKLFVPSASYQNQPPANGRYRVLVRLAAGPEISEAGCDGDEAIAGNSITSNAGFEASTSMGQACAVVTLSDAGLEVELPAVVSGDDGHGDAHLLLVDFDACGPEASR